MLCEKCIFTLMPSVLFSPVRKAVAMSFGPARRGSGYSAGSGMPRSHSTLARQMDEAAVDAAVRRGVGSVSPSPRAGGSSASQGNGSRAASSGLTPIQRANADRLRQRHLYFGGVRADDFVNEVPHSLLEPHASTRMGIRGDAPGFPTTTPNLSPAPYSRSGSSAIVPPGALRSISGKEAFGAASANRSLSGGRSGTVGGMTARRKSLRKVDMNRNVRSFIDNEVLTTTPEISTASSRTISDVESVIRMGYTAGEARPATQLYHVHVAPVSTSSRGKGIQRVAPSGPNNVLCSANAVLETSSEHAFGFERVQPQRPRQATAAPSSPLSREGKPPSHSSSLSEPSVVEGRPLGAVSVSTEEDAPPTVPTQSRGARASRVASSQSVAAKVAPAALDSRGTQYSRQASSRRFVEAGIQAHMEPTWSEKGTEVGRVPSSRVKSEVVEAGVQAAWIPTPAESDDDSAASLQAVTHILVESASSLGTSKKNSDVNRTTPSDQSVESLRDVLAHPLLSRIHSTSSSPTHPTVVASVSPTPSGLRDVLGDYETVQAVLLSTAAVSPTPSTLRELAPLVKPPVHDDYLRPFSQAASISRNPSSVQVHPIPSTSRSHSATVPDAASLSSIAPTSRAASTLLSSSSDDDDEDLTVLERRVEALYRYQPPASSTAVSSSDTSIAKAMPSLLTSTASSNSLLMRVGSNMVRVDTRDVSGRESLRDLAEQIELQEAEARARDEEVNRKKKLLQEQFQQRQLQEQENVKRAEPQTRRVAPTHAEPQAPGELTPSQPSHQVSHQTSHRVSHQPSREASVDFEVHYVSQSEAKARRSISETQTNPTAYVQPSADPSALSEEENEGSSDIQVEEVDLVSYVAVPQNVELFRYEAIWHGTGDGGIDAAPIDPRQDDGALTHSCDACGATNMRGFYCRRCGEELAGARPKECVVCYELAAERYRREAALVRPRGAALELATLAMAGAQQQRGKYCSTCGGDLVEMGTERDRRVVTVSPSPFRERLVSESVATRSPQGPTTRHHADPQLARPEWIDATGFNTTQGSGMGPSEYSATGRNPMNIWYTPGQKASHRRGLGIDDERTPSEASGDPLSSSMEAC